jgi:hypothetical protein
MIQQFKARIIKKWWKITDTFNAYVPIVCLVFWHTVIDQFMQLLCSKEMCNTVFDAHFC